MHCTDDIGLLYLLGADIIIVPDNKNHTDKTIQNLINYTPDINITIVESTSSSNNNDLGRICKERVNYPNKLRVNKNLTIVHHTFLPTSEKGSLHQTIELAMHLERSIETNIFIAYHSEDDIERKTKGVARFIRITEDIDIDEPS